MSYILEALKKLEQKRRHNTIPELLTVRDTVVHGPMKHPLWPYMLFIALLLNAVLLLWWLGPWRHERTGAVLSTAGRLTGTNDIDAVKAVSTAGPTVETRQPEPAKTAGAKAVKAGDVPSQRPDTDISPQAIGPGGVSSKDQPAQDKTEPQKNIPVKPVTPSDKKGEHEISHPADNPSVIDRPFTEPQKHNNGETASEQRIFNLKELPLSVRKGLPDLTISAFLYSSNPSSRMLSINGRTLREGQEVITGLKLEQITRDGAVFSYQGYRFHIGVL